MVSGRTAWQGRCVWRFYQKAFRVPASAHTTDCNKLHQLKHTLPERAFAPKKTTCLYLKRDLSTKDACHYDHTKGMRHDIDRSSNKPSARPNDSRPYFVRLGLAPPIRKDEAYLYRLCSMSSITDLQCFSPIITQAATRTSPPQYSPPLPPAMLPLVRGGGALLLAVVISILVDHVAHAFLPMPRCIMVS